MTYIQPNANGQASSANSSPVVLANDQSAVPVTVSGVSTAAKQDTGNTSVASIDTKTPALGQALAAASVPIVLTAAQLTTLTPPTTVTANAGTGTMAVSLATNTPTIATGTNTIGSVKLTDGTTVPNVKAASTAAVATDPALVVAISPNNTVPVSLASVPSHAVTNAGTFAVQATLQAASGVDIGKLTANQSTNMAQVAGTTTDTNSGVKSAGTLRVVLATDQPALTNKLLVTPDSVALPANQSVNNSQINGITPLMGNGVTGTGSQRVTVASDNTPFAVKTDQTTHGTTDLVAADLTKIAGTAIVNGGLAGSQSIGGTVATNVAITDNPINNGAQAVSSENSAVTTARKVQLVADLVGKLIVLPYANPENFVSGAITTAMTGTTTTSLLAAPAAGLRNYITQITVSNSHATVGTDVIIQDGSGGTTLYTIPAAAVYGGAVITFPTPLRQPSTATAIFCANVTTGASTKVSASGYKGA